MVEQFISIHHDGAADTTVNLTQMIRCNWDTTRSGAPRDSTAALAFKVGFKIRDTFNIAYQDPLVDCGYTVLRNTSMASVITEASFITNPSEARRFTSGSGIIDEADAIYEGLCSYVSNGGIAIVKNSYSGPSSGNGGTVRVDGRWQESPFVTTWGAPESHNLFVPIQCVFPDNGTRTFFRWVWWHDWSNKRDTTLNVSRYLNDYQVSVPMDQFGFHPYLAFYTGGLYDATIWPPTDTIFVGDTVDIPWTVSSGADSTSAVTIDLDRNGGADEYNVRLFGRDWFDRVEGMPWIVSSPTTNNARFRIMADDYAANSDTAESWTFVIANCGQLSVANEVMSTNRPAITQLNLDYDATVAHNLTLRVCRLDGTAWTLLETPYSGIQFPAGHTAIQWTIDSAHQGQYKTYRMDGACSTFCWSAGWVRSDQFSVELAIVNSAPVILQGPFLEGGRTCVEFWDDHSIRANALDEEDGSNLSYQWIVHQGHFSGGEKVITTVTPEVIYHAPPEPPGCPIADQSAVSVLPAYEDTVQVIVSDLHGGVSSAVVYFLTQCPGTCWPPPPCNCDALSDVNADGGADGGADVFDFIYLAATVFSGGPAPLWIETCPFVRGDMNVDIGLDVFDLVVLVDVLFSSMPPPDPCPVL